MLEFKPYFYHIKGDVKKEAIDKVIATDEANALIYFAERKQMSEFAFKQLYNIEIHEETKSE